MHMFTILMYINTQGLDAAQHPLEGVNIGFVRTVHETGCFLRSSLHLLLDSTIVARGPARVLQVGSASPFFDDGRSPFLVCVVALWHAPSVDEP